MRILLLVLSGAICAFMTTVVIITTLKQSLPAALPGFMANPWAVATLADVYCGFLIFYAWVAYKER